MNKTIRRYYAVTVNGENDERLSDSSQHFKDDYINKIQGREVNLISYRENHPHQFTEEEAERLGLYRQWVVHSLGEKLFVIENPIEFTLPEELFEI